MENWLNSVLSARKKSEIKAALLKIDQSLNADDIAEVIETAIRQLPSKILNDNLRTLLFKAYLIRQWAERRSRTNNPQHALFFIADMLFKQLSQRKACLELNITMDELNQAHIEWIDLPPQADCLYNHYLHQHASIEKQIISRYNTHLNDVMSLQYRELLKTLKRHLEIVERIMTNKILQVDNPKKIILLNSALKAKNKLHDSIAFYIFQSENGQHITPANMKDLFIEANHLLHRYIHRPLRRYEHDRGFFIKIKTWLSDTLKQLTHHDNFSTKKTVTQSFSSVARLFHHTARQSVHIADKIEHKKISY